MAITKSVIYYRLISDHGSSRKVRRDQIKIAEGSLPDSIKYLFLGKCGCNIEKD
jgi:hypothetical protein